MPRVLGVPDQRPALMRIPYRFRIRWKHSRKHFVQGVQGYFSTAFVLGSWPIIPIMANTLLKIIKSAIRTPSLLNSVLCLLWSVPVATCQPRRSTSILRIHYHGCSVKWQCVLYTVYLRTSVSATAHRSFHE